MLATALDLRALTLDELMSHFAAASNADLNEYAREIERRLRKELPCWLSRMGASSSDVDEFAQQTWLEVIQYRDSYRPGRSAYSWIKSIAAHVVHDAVRAQKTNKRRPDGELFSIDDQGADEHDPDMRTPLEHAIAVERQGLVRRHVGELHSRLRTVVEMFYFQNLTHSEIAETLCIPVGTAKRRLVEGLAALKEVLSQTDLEE